ncbi:MAG: histidine kinase [Provencibacterium sp.]|jgi:two-component system sensor histidine kinase YesM|nr:histidine kinase [Provencibacterium sp.]
MIQRRFFFKNLGFFLAPMLIPSVVLGSLLIYIASENARETAERSSLNLLRQYRESVELIFGELDSIRQTFDYNYGVSNELKNILRNPSPALEDYNRLSIIKIFLDAPVNSKLYLHSLYLCFPNESGRFIASTDGLVSLETYYDSDWYASYLSEDVGTEMWTQVRGVRRYRFEKEPEQVLTIFKRAYPYGMITSDGIIVINIRLSYFKELFDQLIIPQDQCIFVVSEGGEILLQNREAAYLEEIDLDALLSREEASFTYQAGRNQYRVSREYSERNHWRYLSIVPCRSQFESAGEMARAMLLLSLLSVVLGVALSNQLAKRSYRQLEGIIRLIDSAQKGEELPPLPSRIRDGYGYIQQNIIKTFLEQSYLKMQLSEKKYRLQALELQALQSQINPHFLYNTLETLNWMSIRLTGKHTEMNDILEDLSGILRYTLTGANDAVPLAEEIENTRRYLEIQRIRYDGKFEADWRIFAPQEDYRTLKLLFQPLVENCIYHGIKEKEGKGKIRIILTPLPGRLRIRVVDNGAGMSCERCAALRQQLRRQEPPEQIGLFNTFKRLRLFYGDGFSMQLFSRPGCGCVVRMDLPYPD